MLSRATGRITFDDKQFAAGRVALLAVRQLAGQRAGVQRAFAPHQFLGLASRFAGQRSFGGPRHDSFCVGRMFFEVLAELVIDYGRDQAFDLGIAELGLGLPFELRLAQLDTDDSG